MNVVREINKINELELNLNTTGSWHDDYKDSAYIFVGGLHSDLTEGDVIAIFSQYGEVMDVNLPRDKDTGKTKGFGFLMYEDQRSTVLAVDNLNGATVLERTLRVDHVKNYRQPKVKGEDGEMVEREEQSLNARPEAIMDDDAASESPESSQPPIDPEDPMYEYLVAKRKEEKALKKAEKSKSKSKSKSKGKHKDETPEERHARKERKRMRKNLGKSEGMKGVEKLLNSLQGRDRAERDTRRYSSPPPDRSRSRSRTPRRERVIEDRRYSPERRSRTRYSAREEGSHRRLRSRSRSPTRFHGDERASGHDDMDDDSRPPMRKRMGYD
ncbi:predicted protein [Sparassis crispa]|uniref:RRM domain-containing protein n=1 Tax=Sparassis crispa TaxID=139825 RepID=A0A401GC91_9APHY|nr:predicted protein [Sparassis crispa]GBE79806.1 predicted protein [Sparassis crispa]